MIIRGNGNNGTHYFPLDKDKYEEFKTKQEAERKRKEKERDEKSSKKRKHSPDGNPRDLLLFFCLTYFYLNFSKSFLPCI